MRNSTQPPRRDSRGFSLLELLIVVAIMAIIASLAMINAQRASALAKEQLAVAKLHQIAELQTQFKVTLGRHRYGTLDELRNAQTGNGPLMSPTLAPVDKEGNPQATGGWLIQDQVSVGLIDTCPSCVEGGGIVRLPPGKVPPGLDTGRQFAIEATPVNATKDSYTYCIFEDGVVRRAQANNGDIGPIRGGLDSPQQVKDGPMPCYGCQQTPSCSRSSEPVPNQ